MRQAALDAIQGKTDKDSAAKKKAEEDTATKKAEEEKAAVAKKEEEAARKAEEEKPVDEERGDAEAFKRAIVAERRTPPEITASAACIMMS